MELIDKFALVAEIRKRLLPVIRDKHYSEWEEGQDSERIAILDIIDTLEVKEVDLEKELDEWMKYGPHTNYPWCTIPDAIRITAEHFYELGLKTRKEE